MVRVCINFKSHDDVEFIAINFSEAVVLVNEYDRDSIISVHFYPIYND